MKLVRTFCWKIPSSRLRIYTLFLVLILLPLAAALSPPRMIDLPIQGTPLRIDGDGKMFLAISFGDRDVLGFYRIDVGSYIEVQTGAPVVKTVFLKGNAVGLLSSRDRLAVVEIATKNISIIELEARASTIVSDGENIYIAYPAARKIEKLSSDSLQPVESIRAMIADGADLISAAKGVVWSVSPSLDTVTAYGGRGVSVKLDGIITKVMAVDNIVWVVLNDDSVVKIVDGVIAQKISLPRATFVASIDATSQKLVYTSITRNVIGVVGPGGYRELSMQQYSPSSAAVDMNGRIWFLDFRSKRIGFVYDSQPARIYDWSINRLPNGSVEVRARVSDPEGDIASVDLVAVEFQGIYVLGQQHIKMRQSQDFYTGIYGPPTGITKVELKINATDVAGNSAVQKVGEVDYSVSTTSPAFTTIIGTVPQQDARSISTIAIELLLLIPLILVATFFFLNKRSGRKRRKKK